MVTPLPIEIQGLSVELRGRSVLRQIDLTVAEGDFLGIIGPNGGGKTVLLKTILGLLQPSAGSIRVYGRSPREAHGLVGYVPQFANFDVQFPITVESVVMAGCLAARDNEPRHLRLGYSSADRELVRQALDQVGMTEQANRQIGRLSGGQLQRVMIARALAVQPKLLLLDEPTASLDTPIGTTIFELLGKLAERMSIVLVSHDVGVLSRHVKTIACLNRELHYHHSKEITSEMVEHAYGCPVDLIAHGHAHRVLDHHEGD